MATTEPIIFPLRPEDGWSTDLHDLIGDPDLGTVQQVDEDTKIVKPPGFKQPVLIEDEE